MCYDVIIAALLDADAYLPMATWHPTKQPPYPYNGESSTGHIREFVPISRDLLHNILTKHKVKSGG